MFQIIEKDDRLMPVYSKSDLDYMLGRGWKVSGGQKDNALQPQLPTPVLTPTDPPPKRKYTKRTDK